MNDETIKALQQQMVAQQAVDDEIDRLRGEVQALKDFIGIRTSEVERERKRAEAAEARERELQERIEGAPKVAIEGFFDKSLRYGRLQGIWISDAPTWHLDLEYNKYRNAALILLPEKEDGETANQRKGA